MALDRGRALGAWFRGGPAVRVGLRTDGTPAPIAPPTKLVVVGFYRYVRNPMYLGFLVGWVGLWVIFGRANLAAITGACAAALGVDLFVLLYEEPHLRKLFAAEYEECCRNVRRWAPRMRPWNQ
jgi:protein-S-isoprenylcysteine O-methyltransferase Ste14